VKLRMCQGDLDRERYQMIRFLLTGGLAAGVNVLSRIAFSRFVSFEVAIVLAYLIGMTTAYTLNRSFVFKRSGRSIGDEYLRFTIVNLAAVAQVWVVSVLLTRVILPSVGFLWHAETVAHVIGVTVPVFTSYFGHKHLSFSPAERPS
jgi:putative flippase GtrA